MGDVNEFQATSLLCDHPVREKYYLVFADAKLRAKPIRLRGIQRRPHARDRQVYHRHGVPHPIVSQEHSTAFLVLDDRADTEGMIRLLDPLESPVPKLLQ